MPIPIVLLISLFHFSLMSAQPYVKFIPDKDQVKEVVLENNSYRYIIAIDNAVKLISMLDKSTGYDYMKNNEDLIFMFGFPFLLLLTFRCLLRLETNNNIYAI